MKGVSLSHLPGLRTLCAALLVPALGAALGGAAFAYENAHQAWRPEVTRTATGWRVVEPGGRRPESPMVGGDRLVWTWGANTILMDLTTGKTRLLGAGAHASGALPASISEHYVVFSQNERDGSATVYAYDISSGRRYRLPGDVPPRTVPILAGDIALWVTSSGDSEEVHACDLSTGKQSLIAGDVPRQGGAYPLLADARLVAWSSGPVQLSPRGALKPSPLLVMDTAGGTVTTVPPPPCDPGNSATQTGWFALRDGLLLGLGTFPGQTGSAVLVRDISSSATQTLGTAEPGSRPAMGAGTVVWIERDAGLFGATRIVGRHLDGSPSFEIARVHGAVSSVSIDGDWVAWATQGLAKSWIETAKLPR